MGFKTQATALLIAPTLGLGVAHGVTSANAAAGSTTVTSCTATVRLFEDGTWMGTEVHLHENGTTRKVADRWVVGYNPTNAWLAEWHPTTGTQITMAFPPALPEGPCTTSTTTTTTTH